MPRWEDAPLACLIQFAGLATPCGCPRCAVMVRDYEVARWRDRGRMWFIWMGRN